MCNSSKRMLSLLLSLLVTLHDDSATGLPSTTTTTRSAIVVGGGPAGLATALVLTRHHGYHVTVLESTTQEKALTYNPNKAYLYNVNPRGQVLTKRLPNVQTKLEEQGVGISRFERLTVPGDPSEIFTNVPFSREMSDDDRKRMGTMYWIPRHEFVKLLLDEVKTEPKIEVCFGVACERVVPLESTGLIEIWGIQQPSKAPILFCSNLVVGADGINSNTLQMEPNFLIPVGDGNFVPLNSTANYAIQSINSGPRNKVSLTLLPVKNATAIRPSAICTLPGHEIWGIQDGDTMRDWFANAFPRFSFQNQTLVLDEEWDRFAKSNGSVLPPCQYSPGLYTSNGFNSGIVLVGDALHAFPPDIGQGVNATLGDVAVLDDALYEHDSLSDALEAYEKNRGPDSRALIRLARFGAPFQYGQSTPLLNFRRFLWTSNVVARSLLNKVSMGLIPKPAVLLMMDSNLSFQKVMRRADSVSLSFVALFVAFLLKITKALCCQ